MLLGTETTRNLEIIRSDSSICKRIDERSETNNECGFIISENKIKTVKK